MDTISTPPLILPHSPHSPRSIVDYAPHLEELQYIDIRLRQHQQHLPSPNLTSSSNSTTPQPSHSEEIPTPTVTSAKINNNDNDHKYKSHLRVLSDWGLTFEEIDIARHWGQNPDESLKEKVHMQLLAECATSITNPWSLGDIEELYKEYDTRMAQWNSTIKMSNQSLEKRRAEKALSELVTEMESAGYKNEEMRWVSGVLSYSEQTFWAMKEWCEARLERVRGEIEIKQQRRMPKTDIERRGSPEASGNTSVGGEEREMEVIGVEPAMKRQRCISEKGTERCAVLDPRGNTQRGGKGIETKQIKTRESQRNVNSQSHTKEAGMEKEAKGIRLRKSQRNVTFRKHKLSHDTQERTSQINSIPQDTPAVGTPEVTEAKNTAKLTQTTDTQTYTQVTKSPNSIQIINTPNYTQDTLAKESMQKPGTFQKSANITNTRKRIYTNSNNLDVDPSHTKRLRRLS
ncbi:hypothetical protein BELL_1150g00010 [Botrytis elliptica]|uniref:Uncharacterized protein n=1 Tax=Botrytis elliptica TaxID=278938 RepID=A0A4Z1IQA8_9HELO|nr:hypothetical protein EAE99_011598 [Botrytis elliptica]TGO61652.1 hypothetical protein BELL_1150g00010 [Botrytis elliptica]